MQGRKPKQSNVIPLTGAKAPRPAPDALAKQLCPRGITKEERKEWMRVATLLAEPSLDRLKPHFVDAVLEYCRATVRLRTIRQFFVDNTILEGDDAGPLSAEVYEVQGRNGTQMKTHPHVAQMHETWRQWRSLMMELGLSPASERNMMPGQGDLFNDPAAEFYG